MKTIGAKGLSKEKITQICKIILLWKDKLTWSLLVKQIAKEMNIKVSRQTLSAYFSIKKEFQLKKEELKSTSMTRKSPINSMSSEQELLKKIEDQKKIIESLENKINEQTNQLKTIVYNLRNIPGIDLTTIHIRKER